MGLGRGSQTPRQQAVHYRFGEKPAPKQWYKQRVGWFGYSMLLLTIAVFGTFSFNVRELLLQPSGQLNNQANVNHSARQANLTSNLTAATNIVDLQPVLNSWVHDHGEQNWQIQVASISGPNMDASVGSEQTFSSRTLYRLFVAVALYHQVPAERQYRTTVKAGGKVVSMATCMERLIKADDPACADTLGMYVDPQATRTFFDSLGWMHTSLQPQAHVAETTTADVRSLFVGLNGSVLPNNALRLIMKDLKDQTASHPLTIACPGCSTLGVADYGVGRLEAAGVVNYAKGSYIFVLHADGGTPRLVDQLSGKIQQKIVETTTDAFKP